MKILDSANLNLVACLLLGCIGKLSAQSNTVVFGPRDTLFATVQDQQTFMLHRVKNGQSLFALSQFYNISVADLQSANGLSDPAVKAGSVVRVPVAGKAIVKRRPEAKLMAGYLPVYYRVRDKETLYKIGKEYFRTPVDTLARRNKLKDYAISKGKILLVGWFPRAGVPADIQNTFQNEAQKNYIELKARYEAEKLTQKEFEHEGAAVWRKDDRRASESAFLAMYDLAPLGSVLEVTNPSLNRTLYVKVIAPLPKDAKTGNSIVLLSPAAAKALGAIDEKFYVKIRYLK